MSKFGNGMTSANLMALQQMGDPITINGQSINASLDALSLATYMRLGGKSSGVELLVYVSKSDFLLIGGSKGQTVSTAPGRNAIILKIDDDADGVLLLTCGPFKPSLPGL